MNITELDKERARQLADIARLARAENERRKQSGGVYWLTNARVKPSDADDIAYRAGKIIGDPMPTEKHTVSELKKMGMIGLHTTRALLNNETRKHHI